MLSGFKESQPTIMNSVTQFSHGTVLANLDYLHYDPKQEQEKLYTAVYNTRGLFPQTNATHEPKRAAIIDFGERQEEGKDQRQIFEQYGFCKIPLRFSLTPEECEDEEAVARQLYPDARGVLRQMFPDADRFEFLENLVRKRPHGFPTKTTRGLSQFPPPSTRIHIDVTPDSAVKNSTAAFKMPPEKYRRLIMVNLWKTLQGPGNDWPLALCDRRTVDYGSQTVAHDIVFNDRFNESFHLYGDRQTGAGENGENREATAHEWYYFKDLQDDEAIAFQQYDSDEDKCGGGGVPHAAFFNPDADRGAAPRVSIELRALIYYLR